MLGKKDKCPIQYLLKKTSTELEKALFCFIHFCKTCDTQFEWPLMRHGVGEGVVGQLPVYQYDSGGVVESARLKVHVISLAYSI